MTNRYSPTTADEAGGRDFTPSKRYVEPWEKATTPSKPCTEGGEPPWCKCEGWEPLCLCKPQSCLEGGEHCFCVPYGGEDGVRHGIATCCWCNERPYVRPPRYRVSGHGPYRTELVRE